MSKTMNMIRDVFIEELHKRMHADERIFFLSADFGSPKLDKLRQEFKDRFINVGIAEQALINISTGLALVGYIVYAYAIAPFLAMRAYEQIRVNLSLQSQLKKLNVNLIGVGAGLSYDVSGPTHHALEDIILMRALPNFTLFSPSDSVVAKEFVGYSIKNNGPKYLRFDGKPLPVIYNTGESISFKDGFSEVKKGKKVCLVSTGYMTHKAVNVAESLAKKGVDIGVIDVFLIKPLNERRLLKFLSQYRHVITIEEAFINKGGLDSLLSEIIESKSLKIKLTRMGFKDAYLFNIGNREYLHSLAGLSQECIIKNIMQILKADR